jgi:hypothetical protein
MSALKNLQTRHRLVARQAAILKRVEPLMTTCPALEAKVEQSRSHATTLLEAVRNKAFAPAS